MDARAELGAELEAEAMPFKKDGGGGAGAPEKVGIDTQAAVVAEEEAAGDEVAEAHQTPRKGREADDLDCHLRQTAHAPGIAVSS